MKELSWKAERNGAIYCAPACGGRCTWAAYRKATSAAAALCKRLGSGWRPHVWENLGWHYYVVNSGMSVHVSVGSGDTCYWTMFSLTREGSGDPRFMIEARYADPQDAVQAQIDLCREVLADLRDKLSAFDAAWPLGPAPQAPDRG